MGDFRTFGRVPRQPAVPLQPVIDPAGWEAKDLGPVENWSYRLTSSDCDDLRRGIAGFRKSGAPIEAVAKENFPLTTFAETMNDVREELRHGRGIVMLRGFPVEELTREESAIAFMGIGSHMGRTMSQNKFGHVLGHVTDLGGDYAETYTRGYMTSAEMRFHSDACDYVTLLCLSTAKKGGESRVVSSVTIYNKMLERRPDLVKALCEDYYRGRSKEVNEGEDGFMKQPVFWFQDGYFGAVGAGAAIDKAQKIPGVPKMSEAQSEALAMYRSMANELAADIPFEVGDIQYLNNFVMLHTRRAYEDWPEHDRKRHLLRLWLSDPDNRPIPAQFRMGRSGQGVNIKGVNRNAPLDVERV